MRRLALIFVLLALLPFQAFAAEQVPSVPSSAEKYMPENTESFGQGILEILGNAFELLQPTIADSAVCCAKLMAVSLLLALIGQTKGCSKKVLGYVGALTVSALMLSTTDSMITLSSETVEQLGDYGNALIPIMTGTLAASGGGSSAASLYTGTIVFDSILSSCIRIFLIPLIHLYLVLSVANSCIGEGILVKLRDFIKWLMTWILKIVLYIFTGYMGITKVVSGSADAAVLKATKLTISGMVPVVGGILSDASDSVLASAGIAKSTAGVYGLLAIASIAIEPFFRIGIQYLMLKMTAAVCAVFAPKETSGLINNFSSTMGFVLAMTGSVCLMLLISIVCFMKGVA